MATYPTASELASWLQKDLDTATAELVLAAATAEFVRVADTAFAATPVTHTVVGGWTRCIELPYRPVISVSEVRVNGVVITGWALRKNAVYRDGGFGTYGAFPPDEVAIDLTHGITAQADDVKGAILETAAQAYDVPVGAVASESIDDYAVKYMASGGGIQLTAAAKDLAENYRGPLIA